MNSTTQIVYITVILLAVTGCTTTSRKEYTTTIIDRPSVVAGSPLSGLEECYYEEVRVDSAPQQQRTSFCSTPGFEGVLPRRAKLNTPVDALVVGISHFDTKADRRLTPAHSISAALMVRLLTDLRARGVPAGQQNFSYFEGKHRSSDSLVQELAALRLAPGDRSAREITLGLGNLDRLPILPHMVGHPSDKPWRYLDGPYITKAVLNGHISEQRERALRTKPPLILLYIASHGVVSKQGSPYILTYDSAEGSLDSMLSYSAMLASYRELAQALPGSTVVVIFDTCQINSDLEERSPQSIAQEGSIKNLLALSAASPGEYAWHWPLARSIRASRYADAPIPAKTGVAPDPSWFRNSVPISTTDLGYLNQMSPIAVAAASALRVCDSPSSVKFLDSKAPGWLAVMASRAKSLVEDIPRERGENQNISLLFDLGQAFDSNATDIFACQ